VDRINLDMLAQHWVHSHEEDTEEEMVFRPASYPFPPSRGRKSLQLEPGGRLATSGPGPDDRSVKTQGRWRLESSNRLVLYPAGSDAPKSTLQILSGAPDKLVVKKD